MRENGYIKSFNGKLRGKLLNREVLTEQWTGEYNQVRPRSSLGYLPPAPESTILVTLT